MKKTPPVRTQWRTAALWRRYLFLFLIFAPTIAATCFMARLLPNKGANLIEVVLYLLFGVLFAWISTGFWTALFGFFVLVSRYSGYSAIPDPTGPLPELAGDARTAVLIPVYNEDPVRVEAGLVATWSSLIRTGRDANFDLFILSDTTDPDLWVREEEMWYSLCRRFDARGRIFYRRRTANIKRKSGNVANFCRRWGKNYRYMIVLDADSVMAGDTLVRMADAMERNSKLGILQTPPRGVNRETLIARVQQFASCLYGPLFGAGQSFWQLGDSQYWGHNAIIRIEPFMKHCEMPKLPGSGPLSGEILSHDFVESALMRRAGYEVWLAYNIGGSYEETPPTLIDELKRDRRWCQGNLQHLRLVFTHGFFPTHRALFINGILSYGSALLWLIFLVASSVQAVMDVFVTPDYFPAKNMLFPQWHVWYPGWAMTLLGYTAIILFVPKFLCLAYSLLFVHDGERFGGGRNVVLGVLGECLVSMFLAPIRMIYHSRFVLATLLGWGIGWGGQSRDDRGTLWSEAFGAHWWSTLAALVWGWLIYKATPSFFVWLLPILVPLALSIPLSVFTSRASLGKIAKDAGLFVIPEERIIPDELVELRAELKEGSESRYASRFSALRLASNDGFMRAVAEPWLNALHISLNSRLRSRSGEGRDTLEKKLLLEKALSRPDTLTKPEKMLLLSSPSSLEELHARVWALSDPEAAALWGLM